MAKKGIDSAIIHAKRMAKLNSASSSYGCRTLFMHLSALRPDTRTSHAARHGKLFTADQVREWYARDGNSEGCRCSLVEVLVDEQGVPLAPMLVERAHQTFEKMKAKGLGDWTREL